MTPAEIERLVDKAANDVLLDMPASHHITASKIVIEYHGDAYNNALHCLTAHIAKAIRSHPSAKEAARLREVVDSMSDLREVVSKYHHGNQKFPWAVVREALGEWCDKYDAASRAHTDTITKEKP